jgi:protein tyrosine phosphatase
VFPPINIKDPQLSGPLKDREDLSYKELEDMEDGLEDEKTYKACDLARKREERVINPIREYQTLDMVCSTFGHKSKFIKNDKAKKLNRYGDILSYRDTNVALEVPEGQNSYINANFCPTPYSSSDMRIISA